MMKQAQEIEERFLQYQRAMSQYESALQAGEQAAGPSAPTTRDANSPTRSERTSMLKLTHEAKLDRRLRQPVAPGVSLVVCMWVWRPVPRGRLLAKQSKVDTEGEDIMSGCPIL